MQQELLKEIKENWLQLVGNAEDTEPFDVVVARGDYETMMSLICGDKEDEESPEMPQFEGTRAALNNLTV